MMQLSDIQDFLKTSLNDLSKLYRFSDKAAHVCYENNLHDLKAILTYFVGHETFLKLGNIEIKTDEELGVFCKSILEGDAIHILKGNQGEKLEDMLGEESLKLSLITLTRIYGLSVRAFNVCNANKLHDLKAILTYFKKHNNFNDFRSIGRKTDVELRLFCKNMLHNSAINNLIGDEDEQDDTVLNNLSLIQQQLINRVIEREIRILSPRAINTLNKHCNRNITFSKLYASFNDRSKIAKLDLVGRKTAEELVDFIDLIEAKALYIAQLENDAGIQKKIFSEALMAAFALHVSEIQVYEVAVLATGRFPLFKFLHWLANENKLLNERETTVLRARFGYFTNAEKLTIDELGEQFYVTRERMRQICTQIDSLLSETLAPLNEIKNEITPYLKYPIDFSKDIIHVRESVAKEINDKEGCSFTPKFITKAFGHLYADVYDTVGLELKHFNNTYLVNRNLTAQFDFNAFFNAIQAQLEDDIDKDYQLDFESYLITFLKSPESIDCLLRVQNVCEDIFSSEYTEGGVGMEWRGNIFFKRNTRIKHYELVVDILEARGEPMKLQDIHETLCKSHPKFADRGIETLRVQIRQEKDVFICFSRSSTYGLAKWEKERDNIKGGTIRDIIEAFLNESDEPQHVLAIKEHVATYRPETTCNSLNSTMILKPDRFKDMTCWFYGVPSKDYPAFSCTKVPKSFNKRIIAFMAANPEVSEADMMEQLAPQYNLKTIQIKYYIQYCLEIGKLKRENGQLSYGENSIPT